MKSRIGAAGKHCLACGILLFIATRAPAQSAYLYVSNEGSETVSVVDLASNEEVATIPVEGRPRGIHVAPGGAMLFVALSDERPREEGGEDVIAGIDLSERKIVERHRAGTDPEQFAITPDGRRLYASNEDAGLATAIDLGSGGELASLMVGIEPEGVAVSPDGRWVYVTAETSSTVSVIDTETNTVVANFLVGARPRDAVFSPDGTQAYVTAEIGGTLAIVDVATHTVVEEIDLGDAKPVGMAVSPDGSTLFVANGHADNVSFIDVASRRVVETVPVGDRPWGIAVTREGSTSTHGKRPLPPRHPTQAAARYVISTTVTIFGKRDLDRINSADVVYL